jgi:signal transduction histidine kinase
MNAPVSGELGVAAFRVRLLSAMALVVLALTLSGVYVAERLVRAETQHDLQLAFASELGILRTVRNIRHASLAERCRALVRKPRIRAAFEDNALDLLYPSAMDELGDARLVDEAIDEPMSRYSIRPRFYRFLGSNGGVIPPLNSPEAGPLTPDEEKRLAFNTVPHDQQNGYLVRADGEVVEVIATPIISTETWEPIAALVAGFRVIPNERPQAGLQSGLLLDGRLLMPAMAEPARTTIESEASRLIALRDGTAARGVPLEINGAQHMLFAECLNPNSMFPPAFDVGVFPLGGLLARQSELRWKAGLVSALLLGVGIVASYYISTRLAAPVRELAVVSAENRTLRERAEAALEIKLGELERSARFSADASHQLKTPVAVLRAGLDEILARDEVLPEVREEIAMLVHQTFRLTSIIEDLLLLSRLDSGRLQITLSPLNLTHLVETCLDDIGLLHGDTAPEFLCDIPPGLHIAGDPRYTMLIVQNLLENACKYGREGEPVRLKARESGGGILVSVANDGTPVPRASWEHIFERFHRAAVGENIPGHGLGLNLARELARLHGGELRLVRSDNEGTEFEVRFHSAHPAMAKVPVA